MFRRPSPAFAAFLASAAALVALVAALALDPQRRGRDSNEALVVYCAAALKAPVEEVARDYEAAFGSPVSLQYGGSNTLLAALEVSGRADLYIPADDDYARTARRRGLVGEVIPLARMRPVLAVKKGNPRGVRSLEDVLRRRLRLAQANPEAAAVGRLTAEVLSRRGSWDLVRRCVAVTKPTVNDVAADVALGSVDAGFVWDVTLVQIPGLQSVRAPELDGASALVPACVVRSSGRPGAALHFARFLASGRGRPALARSGFGPAGGGGAP